MISKDEAISQFRQIIGQKASWLKLMGSQFITHLAIFVSWCLREALWKLERLNQEFFLSTALNRSSILAHVEDREYIPRKKIPSTGTIRLTNNGTTAFSLPVHTPFLSDSQLDYATTAAVTLLPGQQADIPASQMEYSEIIFSIDQEKAFFEYLIDSKTSLLLHRFDVFIDLGNGFEPCTYARFFRNCTPSDKVYDEFYSHRGQTGIRFGNGIFGMILPAGTQVKIGLWLTDGNTTLLAGQQLSIVGEYLDNSGEAININAVVLNTIEGGSDEESLEEIRRNLHYWTTYLDKLVWDDDYEFFVRKMLPNIVWCKAWGEQQQEVISGFDVQNINKIFITAYAPDNETLSADVTSLFAGVRLLNRKFWWVAPVFSPFTLEITGKVTRTTVIAEVIQKINDVLEENYGKNSSKRKNKIFLKDIYRLIEETGAFPDNTGAYFEVSSSGSLSPVQLEEMVHIDLAGTTINLTYA